LREKSASKYMKSKIVMVVGGGLGKKTAVVASRR